MDWRERAHAALCGRDGEPAAKRARSAPAVQAQGWSTDAEDALLAFRPPRDVLALLPPTLHALAWRRLLQRDFFGPLAQSTERDPWLEAHFPSAIAEGEPEDELSALYERGVDAMANTLGRLIAAAAARVPPAPVEQAQGDLPRYVEILAVDDNDDVALSTTLAGIAVATRWTDMDNDGETNNVPNLVPTHAWPVFILPDEARDAPCWRHMDVVFASHALAQQLGGLSGAAGGGARPGSPDPLTERAVAFVAALLRAGGVSPASLRLVLAHGECSLRTGLLVRDEHGGVTTVRDYGRQ